MSTYFDMSHLAVRKMLIEHFTRSLKKTLYQVNSAFRFVEVETPVYEGGHPRMSLAATLETSREFLQRSSRVRYKLPMVIWQHGKVFEPTSKEPIEKTMLEYKVLFSRTTGMSYLPLICEGCKEMLVLCGNATVANSDRDTTFISAATGEPLITISEGVFLPDDDGRAPKSGCLQITIAIDTDACVFSQQEHERFNRADHSQYSY